LNRISLVAFRFWYMATTKILNFKSISSKIHFIANIPSENHLANAKHFLANVLNKNCLVATKQFNLKILARKTHGGR
jgi:hypothetical protein